MYYVNQGIEIDEQFRNITGITMQMSTIEYVDKNGEKGLANGSALFRDMFHLYKDDKNAFNEILEESRKKLALYPFRSQDVFYKYASRSYFQKWLMEFHSINEQSALKYGSAILTLEDLSSVYNLSHKKLYEVCFLSDVREAVGEILHSEFVDELAAERSNLLYYALEKYAEYVTIISKKYPQIEVATVEEKSESDSKQHTSQNVSYSIVHNSYDESSNEYYDTTAVCHESTTENEKDEIIVVTETNEMEPFECDNKSEEVIAEYDSNRFELTSGDCWQEEKNVAEVATEYEKIMAPDDTADDGETILSTCANDTDRPAMTSSPETVDMISAGLKQDNKELPTESKTEKKPALHEDIPEETRNDSTICDANENAIPFYEKYNIDIYRRKDEFSVSVDEVGLSVRLRNVLILNKCYTVGNLLMLSVEDLYSFKNAGKKTVDEAEKFVAELNRKNIKMNAIGSTERDGITDNTQSEIGPWRFKITRTLRFYRKELREQNYSALPYPSLSDAERRIVNQIKEARTVVDKSLVDKCFSNDEYISVLSQMLVGFYSETNLIHRNTEMLDAVYDGVPVERRKLKASGFIAAYSRNEVMRNMLLENVKDEMTLDQFVEFIRTAAQIDAETLKKYIDFLKWCSFDIDAEIDQIWSGTIKNNSRTETILKMRSQKNTLQEIGEKLGITRERVRQIERKATRIFLNRIKMSNVLMKIYALRDQDSILTPEELSEYFGDKTDEYLYLLKNISDVKSMPVSYDSYLDVFIVGDETMSDRVQLFINNLPDHIEKKAKKKYIKAGMEEYDLNEEIIEEAIEEAFDLTGNIYHKTRLSLTDIYRNILSRYYPNGIHIYDEDELADFKAKIRNDYGNISLPDSIHAIGAGIARISILRDRGVYALEKADYISLKLQKRILDYIRHSRASVVSYSAVFVEFQDELNQFGIDNRYYLQGVMRHYFDEKLILGKDYIYKNSRATSMTSEIVKFIKKSSSPVSKVEIQTAFPGVTDIVINNAVSQEKILNYYGLYYHASHLQINQHEKQSMLGFIKEGIEKTGYIHSKDLFPFVQEKYALVLSRNGIGNQFSLFSALEYLYRNQFTFERPYIVRKGYEIDRPEERMREYVSGYDVVEISEIMACASEIHLTVYGILDLVNSFNDNYVLVDDERIASLEYVGITDQVVGSVLQLIETEIDSSILIRDLDCIYQLPSLNVPWNEWLVYSIVNKWSDKLEVGATSNQFRLAVPIVAIKGHLKTVPYEKTKEDHGWLKVADDLNNIDSLIEDVLDEELDFGEI